LADRHRERLAMGFLFVRAHAGMARAFFALNARREGERHLALALEAFQNGREWNFGWIGAVGLCRLFACLDLAVPLLESGRPLEATPFLEEAVDTGWGDWEGLMEALSAADPLDALTREQLLAGMAAHVALPPLPEAAKG